VSDIENAILEVLNGDTAVRALVGARIFENQIAQNAQKPALTYQLVSDPSEDSHSGPAGLAYARMQFDGWGLTKEDARAVTRAVRLALAGINRSVAGVKLSGGFKLNERALFDPDVRLRRRTMDMGFWHSEETP
jgi:hypothetical protein